MKNKRVIIPALFKASVMAVLVAFVFYNRLLGLIPGLFVAVYVFKLQKKSYEEKQRRRILLEFKNMINAMQSSLEAGNSIERAIISAGKDMQDLYGDKSEIVKQIKIIEKKLRLNIPLETALAEMAEELDQSEIYDFVEIISTIKRTGGNAVRIIRNTVEKLTDEIELDAELEVMVAAKKYEQQIMVFMPALIVVFLRMTTDGFMAPLYGSPLGIIIMSVVLLINVGADLLGRRIVDIG